MINPSPPTVPAAARAPAPVTPLPTFSTTTGASIDPSGERRGFDFRHFWHSLLEKLWIVALCVLAGLFLGLGYLARTPKLYRGHTVLEVDVSEPSPITTEDSSARMRSMFLASQEAMRTIEQNLVNRTLMARVIRAEGLADDGGRALLGTTADNETAKVTPAQPKPAASATPATGRTETTYTPLEEGLAGALSTMVKPVIRRGTRLIDLFVTNPDPVLAQRLTEAVGREYIRSSIERRAGSNQETLRYLLEEEERLKANLQKSEAAVAEYKAKTPDALQLGGGTTSTGSQPGAGSGTSRGGLVEDKLQELTSKVTAAKSDRIRLESEIKQIEQLGDNVDALLAIPSIAAAPAVNDRRRDVAQLETVVAGLTQRYKDKHPKMMAARAALAEAKDALKRAVIAQPAVLQSMLEQARATETNLSAATQEQEKAAVALNKAAIGYHELARQAETDRALYESVLRQIKETNLTKDVKTNAVTVIEHSPLPGAPVSPSIPKAIALGLLGGLALGLAFVYASDALDRSIKTVDQAEAHFGLPVLAAVPEVKKDEVTKAPAGSAPPGSESYRLVAEAPEGPAAEAFRNLRASLSLLGPEDERKVFLFTSALPSEGKSFTSANYALALAQQGFRVLLIDGDLRRPSLHKIFLPADGEKAADEERPGIVDYLVGDIDLDIAARPISAGAFDVSSANGEDAGVLTATGGKLSVLTGGRRAPNPAELLSGPSFGKLIAEAARRFDRVVIDSAPILAVSDTLLMTPLVQTVCVVVRASNTPRHAVQRALGMLTGAGGRPAGVVLNRLPRNRGSGYYYYYASHGYGKGEGAYSAEPYGSKKRSDRAS
ncbi:MAG: polysaccharide biosynthesis transport protein [Verrucomicrobiota bacterium]|jgi:capsular exopolysaccharide synthesis family protein